MTKEALISVLKKHQKSFYPLIHGLKREQLMPLDLSEKSNLLKNVDLKDTAAFDAVIFGKILKDKAGIGGYFENRAIYQRSTHYDGTEARSLHLGLDLWMPAGVALHSPLSGKIHSLQDNQGYGNYGPTIIVEHRLDDKTFFLLYGHLDSESLNQRQAGDTVNAGEKLAHIGDYPENGDWPPHLHWQMMTDMLGKQGDFPGVVAPSEREYYLQICINPAYILKLDDETTWLN